MERTPWKKIGNKSQIKYAVPAKQLCNMDKKDIICLILLIYHKFIFNETFLAISQY